MRAQSRRVTQRCHNSPRREMGDGVRMMSRTGSVRWIWGIWRKLSELKLDAERGGLTFGARWGETSLCAMGAARDKDRIVRLCRSPYVETFNSNVIKRFRTWTKKSLRVFEFRDSRVLRYVYMLPTFDVRFAHGRIWLWYIITG